MAGAQRPEPVKLTGHDAYLRESSGPSQEIQADGEIPARSADRAEATGWLRGGRLSPVIWPEGLAAELSQWREGRQGRSVRVQAAAVTATRQPGQQRRRRAGDGDGRAGVDVQRGGAGKGHGRRVAAAVHPGGYEG